MITELIFMGILGSHGSMVVK